MYKQDLLCFSLCPLPHVLSLGTHRAVSLAPFSLHLLFIYLYMVITSPELSLLQAEQSQLAQPFLIEEMLQSLHHLHGPSMDFLN